MNFFELQDRARSQTRWMVGAFCIAVLLTVLAVNAMVLYGVWMIDNTQEPKNASYTHHLDTEDYCYISAITT